MFPARRPGGSGEHQATGESEMPTQEINVPELCELEKQPDDPRWSLPAVAFLRDGSVVRLGGRSLREAHEEVRRAGDSDIYIDGISADALRNLGVVLPEGHEPGIDPAETDLVAMAAGVIETADKWAQVYAAACEEVIAAAMACLEPANVANGARNKIRQHQNDGLPGTPIAIRNFTQMAEEAEQKFLPLYRIFAEACVNAQDAAASFIAAVESQEIAEASMVTCLDDETCGRVATVKAILRSNHGPSPEVFIASVEETNSLIQRGSVFDDGNIYTPPSSAQSDERTCPWCAETIKAAAVICRFCDREVQAQPNAS